MASTVGLENRNSLDFEWSKTDWFANGPDFAIGSKIRRPSHFKYRQMTSTYFVKNHLKCGQKYPDFYWSGFVMVGTITL